MSTNPTTRTRRIVRALPSPTSVALIGLMAAVAITGMNGPLLWVALAYALYVTVTSELGAVLDPGCTNPEHQHDDCPPCADLEPLTVRALVGRERSTR